MLLLTALPCLAASDDDSATPETKSHPRVVRVNCTQGARLAHALKKRGEELIILFSGVCHEELAIRRDRVTLEGRGANPAIEGTLLIEGASEVVLRNFTVRKSPDCGVCIYRGAAATLENMVIEDTARVGVEIVAADADLRDLLTQRTGGDGIIMQGARINFFGNITCTDNDVNGIAAFQGVTILSRGATVRAERNMVGMAYQLASAVTFLQGKLIANDNTLAGIVVAAEGTVGHAFMDIEIRNNGVYGLWVDELASFQAFAGFDSINLFAENGKAAIFVANGSLVRLGVGTEVVNNLGVGIQVDDGRVVIEKSTISGNLNGDVTLSFGSRATFGPGNLIATPIQCDDTVLVRGDLTCGAPLAQPSEASAQANAELRALLARIR